MPGTKPGSDKPTGRVVVVIVLLMLAKPAPTTTTSTVHGGFVTALVNRISAVPVGYSGCRRFRAVSRPAPRNPGLANADSLTGAEVSLKRLGRQRRPVGEPRWVVAAQRPVFKQTPALHWIPVAVAA